MLGIVWQRVHRPGSHLLLLWRHQEQELLLQAGQMLVQVLRQMVSVCWQGAEQ